MAQALHHRIVEVNTFDASRLRSLIRDASTPGKGRILWLSRLHRILNAARLVMPHDVRPDTITMNSTAGLRDNRGKTMSLTLVFPESASTRLGAGSDKINVSILTPLGLLLFGRRIGDCLYGRIMIERMIFQPEASGDYEL